MGERFQGGQTTPERLSWTCISTSTTPQGMREELYRAAFMQRMPSANG